METDEPQQTHAQLTRKLQMETLPWVEKYRPKQMTELVSHEDIISTITRLIDSGKLPHMLLYGPAGTGKTSTILACAHKMYGKHYSSMVLELNASDERGIDVVRDQIKEFAGTRQMFCSMPKMIVLDEADNMTNAAQFALRRVIEKYTKNARFCLICNYASKIIPALQSRCTRFRFAPLSDSQALERLKLIAEAERCALEEGGLEACVTLGTGDMRKSINILQSTSLAFAAVNPTNVYQCTGQPMPADVQQVLEWLMEAEFPVVFARTWELMRDKGLALVDVTTELHKYVTYLETSKPIAKAMLVASLADLEQRLSVGTNEKLQLGSLIGVFHQARVAMAA